ncbi:MAG TPA: rhodanese-like domain-containing protein [Dermatophilaceae bacterium]|nr:rhodanese-like domain-containing protein [Dermatophilaceae bacterium]
MSAIPAERQFDVPAVSQDQLADNTVMLDVREPDEWALGRAPRAVHIPLGQLEDRIAEVPAEVPLVVACRSGVRSSRAVAFLQQHGLAAVNLEGGMLSWHQANRPMCHDGSGTPEVC